MAAADRRQKRVREKLMNRSHQERYDWLIALKSGTDCILQIEDKYRIFRRMEAEFGELAELTPEEAGDFSHIDECARYRDECKSIADEMEKDLPEETQVHSRTEMMSAGQRQAHDKESGNQKPGIFRWILLGVLVLGVAFGICFKIPVTRGFIGEAEKFIGMNSMAIKSFRVSGEENGGWDKALAVEKHVIATTDVGKKVKFGKREWIVVKHQDDRTLLIAKEALKNRAYHRTEGDVTWADCSLRKYLNHKFLEKNFYPKEAEAILETALSPTENTMYPTKDVSATSDRVFIASDEDVTAYEDVLGDIGKNMRLRTPGRTLDTTSFVSALGDIIDNGFPAADEGVYVRPMMWVNTKGE